MLNRIRQRGSDFASDWAGPIVLGLITAAAVWTVWYFTKAPCTTAAATNGLCHPGIIARHIDVEILLQSGGAALAVGALKGGYDRYIMRNMLNQERNMLSQEREALNQEREALNREREARHLAEQQLADERKRADEAQAAISEMFNEFREEVRQQEERRQREEDRRQQEEERRRQQEEERRQREEDERREERRIFVATQQALLDTITRLSERGNGRLGNEG